AKVGSANLLGRASSGEPALDSPAGVIRMPCHPGPAAQGALSTADGCSLLASSLLGPLPDCAC
ncbi:hypothetical protein, partial [Yersinia entomophaga]|uniref:hypothetical protein n=1 Tax=Yersinia entomophaga TaxID=935293 RepID=UPI001C52B625